MKKSIYLMGFVSLALLAACAAPAETNFAPVSVESFTTEGKPTKIVETPWGAREVYDPTQDAEVVAAFKYVYRELPKLTRLLQEGTASDDEIEITENGVDRDFKDYFEIFSTARDIQQNDLLRLGCSKPVNTRHCDFENQEARTTIPQNCKIISYGSVSLNVCEEQSSSWIVKDVIALAQSPCVTDLNGERHSLMSPWQIGQKNNPNTQTTNDKNLPVGKNAQLKSYFLSECREFDK